jgi:hypothetical protein
MAITLQDIDDSLRADGIDPNTGYKLAQMPQTAQAQQGNGFINSLAQSAPVQGVLGAGDALRSFFTQSANMLPGVNIPDPRFGNGNAYDVGRFAGNVGTFVGGGEALDSWRALTAAKDIPLASQVASLLGKTGDGSFMGALPGVAKRAIGSGIYGALTNQDDRAGGAAEGSALSAGLDTLPGAFGLAGKLMSGFKPQQTMENIISALSGGKGLEENSQSLAQDIQNTFQQKVNEGQALYQPVFDQFGNSSLELNNPLRRLYNTPSQYLSLGNDVVGSYDRDLKDVHDQFLQDPTLQNAHSLQSQLGSSIRDLQATESKSGLTAADRSTLQGYQKAQQALKTDINQFLYSKSPDLANQYQSATQNWAQNVVPYLDNRGIAGIAKGDITNPRDITNIFKSPEPNVQKIVDDLPDDAKNKVLYSILGKTNATKSPQNLVNAFNKLDEQGLSSYVTPDLASQISQLSSAIGKRTNLDRLIGVGAGALLGHGLGIAPMAAELAGAAGGALFGPQLLSKIPSIGGNEFISTLAKNAYPGIKKAILANNIPGVQ